MVGSGSVYASTVAGSGEVHTFAGIEIPAPSASATAPPDAATMGMDFADSA